MQDTAKTPYIRFLVVLAILPDLGRHHKGSADFGLSQIKGLAHEFGYAEVSDLDLPVSSEEDVIGFEIAVQDLLVVDVLEA